MKKIECFECGSIDNIHNHHVVPKVMGGTKTIPLCGECHGKVHGKSYNYHWKELQMIGIRKRQALGLYKGRPAESIETPGQFISKSKNQKILKYLNSGYTYDEIRSIMKCSPSTISKVKKINMQLKNELD